MSLLKNLQIEVEELRRELEREKRWYTFVVNQRDRAWNELDTLKNLRRGTTARKHKFETPEGDSLELEDEA